MIAAEPRVPVEELHRRTGWELKPEGACKGEMCVPLPPTAIVDGNVELQVLSERLRMPLVHDAEHGLWALGPEVLGGRTLLSAQAPELVLPDFDGNLFALSSLRGQKVVLTAWASW